MEPAKDTLTRSHSEQELGAVSTYFKAIKLSWSLTESAFIWLFVAHFVIVELVIMRESGPESKRLGGLSLAVEGLEAAPSRGIASVRAADVSLGAGRDNTAAYDGAEAWLVFGVALPGLGGGGTFGPQGSPSFWHCLHFSWFEEFLSSGSHCCGLDSKSERTREKQRGLKQNGALEGSLAFTFLFLQNSHFKVLARFGPGCGLVARRWEAAEADIFVASNGYTRPYTEGNRITN